MNIKNIINEIRFYNKFLRKIYYLVNLPLYSIKKEKNTRNILKRKNGQIDENYKGLLKFKEIHKGKRCFIIATGPSLKIEDLELLKNEYTFSMNSICKAFEKTDWRPTYYGFQDATVYKALENEINNYFDNGQNVFVADIIYKKLGLKQPFQQFPLDVDYHRNEFRIDKYFANFSDDAYAVIYDGYTITYSIIQLAVYMGFTEIYLLGTDCTKTRGKNNHFIKYKDKEEYDIDKTLKKLIVGFQAAQDYAKSNGISIVNCTRGGDLEIFPRMKLEDILNNINNN